MTSRIRTTAACILVAAGLAATTAGCGGASESYAISSLDALAVPTTTAPVPGDAAETTAPPTTISERQRECEERSLATASYEPSPTLDFDDGSFMQHLRKAGRIVVGVDENTRGLSARDPQSGEIEGFEVELAHEIAEAVFDTNDTSKLVKLIPLLTSEKTKSVANGQVDLTISAATMSCDRWEQVDFSVEYYTAHQEFLVRSDSTIRTADDLAGRVVCVTANSSSQRILTRLAPEAELLPVDARTDCLVALQNGEADAYFGHDTFQYGMVLQDPTMEIRPGILPPEETVSHYGIAISREHPDFTRFVNRVLVDLIADGRWDEMANKWLVEDLEIHPDSAPQHPVPNTARVS